MIPAVIGSVLVAALVALTHAHLFALTLCVLAVSFTSVMWTAWGKRGGPQTFAMVLAGRYRTLALVDSLRALSQLMRTQAAWTSSLGQPAQAAKPEPSLLPMVRQQAAIADVFQSARDLLYSQAAKAPATTPPSSWRASAWPTP